MERPAVGCIVGFQDRAVGVPGQGLFQGHTRRHPGGGGKVVDHQGPTPGVVHHQGGQIPQVGLPLPSPAWPAGG